MIKHLEKEENLEELIKNGLYIIDFYAEWCGPCKMLGPVLEELEDINVIKIDVDLHRELATQYGIMSVPTMLFIKNGEIKVKTIGFKSKEEIIDIYKQIN